MKLNLSSLADETCRFYSHIRNDVKAAIGFVESEVLAYIVSWIKSNRSSPQAQHNGRTWMYDTFHEMHRKMPWLKLGTIRRAIANLRRMGILRVERLLARLTHNQMNFYALEDEQTILKLFESKTSRLMEKARRPKGKFNSFRQVQKDSIPGIVKSTLSILDPNDPFYLIRASHSLKAVFMDLNRNQMP